MLLYDKNKFGSPLHPYPCGINTKRLTNTREIFIYPTLKLSKCYSVGDAFWVLDIPTKTRFEGEVVSINHIGKFFIIELQPQ